MFTGNDYNAPNSFCNFKITYYSLINKKLRGWREMWHRPVILVSERLRIMSLRPTRATHLRPCLQMGRSNQITTQWFSNKTKQIKSNSIQICSNPETHDQCKKIMLQKEKGICNITYGKECLVHLFSSNHSLCQLDDRLPGCSFHPTSGIFY